MIAGVCLAWLAQVSMGSLAALPAPASLMQALRGHPELGFLVHTTLLVHVPVALMAGAVGYALFRGLRTSSWAVVALCAAPWLALGIAEAAEYIRKADLPVPVALGNVLGWQSLLGLAAVPVGLWVAARIQRRHAH